MDGRRVIDIGDACSSVERTVAEAKDRNVHTFARLHVIDMRVKPAECASTRAPQSCLPFAFTGKRRVILTSIAVTRFRMQVTIELSCTDVPTFTIDRLSLWLIL